MNPVARTLVGVGLGIAALGGLWEILNRFGAQGVLSRLGHLPGDIVIDRPGFKFYFPLATSLLASLVLSAIAYAVRRLR